MEARARRRQRPRRPPRPRRRPRPHLVEGPVATSAGRDIREGAPVTTEDVERKTARIPRPEGSEVCDEAGLRDAFLAHGGELLGFARRSLYSSSGAEDAVQETFARAWRSRARFDPTLGSLRTWLFTIERRVIIDIGVRQMKTRTVPIDQGEEPVAEDHLETAMLGWQMESALARLDPEHRMVITELYFNGRTGREVAELFGLPEGTVRS